MGVPPHAFPSALRRAIDNAVSIPIESVAPAGPMPERDPPHGPLRPTALRAFDKPRAVRQVHRVLRVGGVFICLTPNGGYCWYRHLAPWLGLDTRHLPTDRFLTAREVETLIGGAGLALQRLEYWRFILQGDLPVGWGYVLRARDGVAGHLRVGYLRGGIAFSAVRTD